MISGKLSDEERDGSMLVEAGDPLAADLDERRAERRHAFRDGVALRGFVARLLGWSRDRAVDLALRALELAAEHRAELVLCGAGDMVPIARALHRRALGAERPIVVCDPRRRNTPASPRSPANHASGLAALAAAVGGSLCVRAGRPPRDFSALVARLRSTDDVQFVVCTDERDADHPYLVRPAPIHLPPLAGRAAEIDRVITEYAADACAELGVPPGSFTASDHAWVRQHAATLADVEKATLRLVAVRTSRNMSDAAARLGMAPVSLSRWIGRRRLAKAPSSAPTLEVHRATPTLAQIWESHVLDMLEEPQREGRAPPFAFGDANIRNGAKEWLARIKSGPDSLESREAIAGLEALLADLEVRMAPADPGSDKPQRACRSHR